MILGLLGGAAGAGGRRDGVLGELPRKAGVLLWLEEECELGPFEKEEPALDGLPELYELRDERELEDRLEEREKLEELEELECDERELELCLLGGIVFHLFFYLFQEGVYFGSLYG